MDKYLLINCHVPVLYKDRFKAGIAICEDPRITKINIDKGFYVTLDAAFHLLGIKAIHNNDFISFAKGTNILVSDQLMYALEDLIPFMKDDDFFMLFNINESDTFEKWFIKDGKICKTTGSLRFGPVTEF